MTLPIRPSRRAFAAAAGAFLLAGCGFQLRGSATLPFESVFVDLPATSSVGVELKRNLRAGTNTKVIENRADAQAIITNTSETRSKTILSLNSSGRVREFRLRYTFSYSVVDQKSQPLAAPGTIVLERDYTYSDDQILAKESEEALLYRDMQTDLVQQVIRRLAAAKRPVPAAS
jgi:LPS-assembly lipoprotein